MCPKIKGNIIFVALSSSSSPMICQAPKCDFKLDRHSTIYIAMFFTDIALFYLIPLVLSVIVINIREGDKTKRVFLKDHVLNLWTPPPPSIPLRTPKVTFHQKWLFKVKNTIRDGGTTSPYTHGTVETVDTVDMVYTVGMVYTSILLTLFTMLTCGLRGQRGWGG